MKQKLLFLFVSFPLLSFAQEQFPVYFDFDKDVATASSQEKFSDWLETHRNADILNVYGYADSVGTPEYNIKLSQRRAAFVANRLKQNGHEVAAETQVKGFGETTVFSENNSIDRVVMIHYYNKPVQNVTAIVTNATEPVVKPVPLTLTELVDKAKTGDRLRLPNMNFFNGLDVMVPESEPVLKELLEIMKQNPKLKITVEGHICCDRLESNKLSIRRARLIYKYLIAGGIAKKRLDYRGYAGTSPIHFIPEKNEEQRAENRRVEIHITAK